MPQLGQDFFPTVDAGQFLLHVRARTGTRIEETDRLADQVEAGHPAGNSRRTNSAASWTTSAFPNSCINLSYNNSGVIGTGDADILVSLNAEPRAHGQLRAPIARAARTGNFPASCFISCRRTS